MSQKKGRTGHGGKPGARKQASLQLEALEDRWMPAVIGGIVYLDINSNGLYEQGESGLGGSTIQLRDNAGHVIATTTSDPSTGRYQFTQRDQSLIQPATLEQTANFPVARTNQSRTATIQQFDPSLGQLTSIEIQAQGNISIDPKIENMDDGPATIQAELNGQMSFTLPGANGLQINPSTKLQANVAAFDGQADLSGASAHDFGATALTGTFGTVNITDPAALAAYVGNGTVSVGENATANTCACGTGNLLALVQSVASGSVKVIYHYTPSPVIGPGQYVVVQTKEPPGITDWRDTPDNQNVIPNSEHTDTIQVTINTSTDTSLNNNFGERTPPTPPPPPDIFIPPPPRLEVPPPLIGKFDFIF